MRAIPNLVAALLVTLVTLSYSISYAALIFNGDDLQPHLAAGIHAALMAAWVVALVVALGSSFHFSIAGPDSNATAILALMASGVAAEVKHLRGSGADAVPTVLLMLAGSALLGGLLVFLIGALRRGRLIRFLPYPVVGGFLAGTGYLVFSGGLKVLTGSALTWADLLSVPAVGWVVAAVVASSLLVIPRFLDATAAVEPAASPFTTAIIAEMDLRQILSRQFSPQALDVLIRFCERLKLQPGLPLFQRGDPADSLYFIERGEVSVLLRLDDGKTKRLRAFGPGTIVGEMGLYTKQPRSADVVADGSCRVRKLSAAQLARLEREHPDVAIAFHSFVIRLLSSRLAAANEEIRALL